MDLRVSVYGADGAALPDTGAVNNSRGIYFLGCEVRRLRRAARVPLKPSRLPPRSRAARARRAPQHDTMRAVLQLTGTGFLPDCLAGVTYASSRCDVSPVRVYDTCHVSASVATAALLTLTFINCGEERASAAGVDFVLLNPGGQTLPTGQAPLPPVYLAFALAWGGLVAAAGAAMRARRRVCSPVHALLLSVPLLKVVHMAVAQAKWAALSRMGVRNPALDMTLVVALTISQVDYLGVLLLLSRGWHVTRTTLGAPERNSLLLSLSLLASLFFVYHLWSPRSYFALAIAYVCVLGVALSSVSHGLRHLKAQAHLLRMSGSEADDAAAWTRVAMFAGYHGALFVFTSIKIVLHLVQLFMPEEEWLHFLFWEARPAMRIRCASRCCATRARLPLTLPHTGQVSDFGLAAVLAVLFRPRAPSPFVVEGTVGALHAAAGNVIAGRGRISVPSDDDLARAIAAMGARSADAGAAPPAQQQQQQQQQLSPAQLPVLVENPCSFDAAGRAVMSVSVGLPQHKPEEASEGGSTAAPSEAPPPSPQPHAPPQQPQPQQQAPPTLHSMLHTSAPATAAEADAWALSAPPAPHLELTVNPLWGERRLTQTQPSERDSLATAVDRFRVMWGAPPERPLPPAARDASSGDP